MISFLFFGDNLSDFTGFDGKSVKDRNQAVADSKAQFGENCIISLIRFMVIGKAFI